MNTDAVTKPRHARRRLPASNFPWLRARILGLALAAFGAPNWSLAQNVGATLDDNVPAGAYRQQGDTLNYTTVITNGGGANATGVTLTNPAPAGTSLVTGSVHASPLAFADTYSAVGNTKLYVGTTPPAADEPARVVAGPGLLANDTIFTPPDTIGLVTTGTVATTQGGSVAINSGGTFTYTPPVGFTGTDSFSYSIRNSADATLADTGTVTITVSNRVWYVNNAVTNGNGTSTSPFNSLASLNGASANVDGANDFIYVYRGSGAAYTGGLPLASGQTLTSESNALVVGGITLRDAQPAPNIPTLSHTTAQTVVLASDNIVDGFIITNSNGSGISGSAIGTTAIADIAVSVTGGTALNATTSGTLTVTGSANTLSSTNGTALNVSSVTIGASDLTFQRISASGGTSGIVLNTTGGSGGLTVTGTGPANSGGTIQNSSGVGIVLSNVGGGVSLSSMSVSGSGDDGIRGSTVTGFTLASSTVSNNGNAVGERGIELTQLGGSGGISNSTITGSSEHNVIITNDTANLTAFNVTGTTFSTPSFVTGDDGFQVLNNGSASMTVSVTGSTFTDTTTRAIISRPRPTPTRPAP
jgi:uncharacterized repeat protein (TIGR01451 family)